MVRTPYWATVTRGLEMVARDELVAAVPVDDIQLSYRRVQFSTPSIREILALRTIDDLFLDVAVLPGMVRQRIALATLTAGVSAVDFSPAVAHCRKFRHISDRPSFSVTVNFVGRRNYSTEEIKQTVAPAIARRYGWAYHQRDIGSEMNVRLFIEHDLAYIGVRLTVHPLHERAYRVATLPGALKPTIAAAMVYLGGFPPQATILDPFCGTGTIPIEAARMGMSAFGSDLDHKALVAAQENGAAAGSNATFHQWDARALPLPNRCLDGLVSNLPWGRQVAIAGNVEHFYRQVLQEMERAVTLHGRIILLCDEHASLCHAARDIPLTLISETSISLYGRQPVISIWSPT